jgi:hypothetical protein
MNLFLGCGPDQLLFLDERRSVPGAGPGQRGRLRPHQDRRGEDAHRTARRSGTRCFLGGVADPGSGAFLTPGAGIRNRFFPDPGSSIPYPKPTFLIA